MFVSRKRYNELGRCYKKALRALEKCGGRIRIEREFKDEWRNKYAELKKEFDCLKIDIRKALENKKR